MNWKSAPISSGSSYCIADKQFFCSLPRIENALPGRDGYEAEIFGMEGIPAPDVADYKRRKEIELGFAAESTPQPPPKRAKIENCPLTEEALRW
jgi:hypothetical protein